MLVNFRGALQLVRTGHGESEGIAMVTRIEPGELVETGKGVFYSASPLPIVDDRAIAFLKRTAGAIPQRRARFCAHPAPDAAQHDMLIVSHRDTYVAPHRHRDQAETFVVIEGTADILLFGENGKLEAVVRMGPLSSGLPFFYRMPARQYHSLSIESELLVFLESTSGPFRADNCEYAAWAPAPSEIDSGRAFIASALQSARSA
jgi:cupin fold WbuC family metalloprotein